MMTNSDREGQIFLSRPYTINGFFFLLTTKYLILYCKNTSLWLFIFYLAHRLVRVCVIELSHMGENRGNSYLVSEKKMTHSSFTIRYIFEFSEL